jgi:hypothetical protein
MIMLGGGDEENLLMCLGWRENYFEIKVFMRHSLHHPNGHLNGT